MIPVIAAATRQNRPIDPKGLHVRTVNAEREVHVGRANEAEVIDGPAASCFYNLLVTRLPSNLGVAVEANVLARS